MQKEKHKKEQRQEQEKRKKEKAKENYHSTAKEAAELAKKAGVTNLILTHFSARYDDSEILLKEAQTVHGSVIAAKDLLEIEIK